MKYVSIDIETSGLDPDLNDVLEFAAVIDIDDNRPVEELPYVRRYIHHDLLRVSPDNMKFLGTAYYQKWLDSRKVLLSRAVGDLFSLMSELIKGDGPIPIAGANYPSFDHQFLLKNDVYKEAHYRYFGHRYLSPAMFYLTASDETIPDTEEICHRAGVNYNKDEAHDALYDSRLIVQLVRNAKHR